MLDREASYLGYWLGSSSFNSLGDWTPINGIFHASFQMKQTARLNFYESVYGILSRALTLNLLLGIRKQRLKNITDLCKFFIANTFNILQINRFFTGSHFLFEAAIMAPTLQN